MDDLIVTHHDAVCVIALGDGLNTLSFERTQKLAQHIHDADQNQQTRVVIIRGNEKAFSVGADVKELSHMLGHEDENDDDPLYSWLEPWRSVARARKPVIAAVDGYVFGGGLEIALMADIIIATPETQCAQPEINLGFIPGCGGTVRLFQQLGYQRAFYMCATGQSVPISKLKEWGIVHDIVDRSELMAQALRMAQDLARRPLMTLMNLKALMKSYRFGELPAFHNALAREYNVFRECAQSENGREGIAAFLEKRDPEFS